MLSCGFADLLIMVLWYYGVVVLWCCGVVVLRKAIQLNNLINPDLSGQAQSTNNSTSSDFQNALKLLEYLRPLTLF